MSSSSSRIPPPGPADHARGPAGAPTILIMYGDYECPYSARAHAVLLDMLPMLEGEVRYIFRNFPISDVHRNAQMAAEAAESVGAHGGEDAFWDMHDVLFENLDALELDDLLGYAEACGVDVHAVADDLASGAMTPRVRRDFEGGARDGVDGTPTFFVNGRRFEKQWTDPEIFAAEVRDAAGVAR